MSAQTPNEKPMKQLDIAVDFDGTCVTHDFPKIGKDIGSVPVLKRLVECGHRLILYTMRGNVSGNTGFSKEVPVILNGDFLDDAVNWFKDNGIELYSIQVNPQQAAWTTSPKCYAQLYIDDAALGAPLMRDERSDRPFIDWYAVELILEGDGVLPATHVWMKMTKPQKKKIYLDTPNPTEMTPTEEAAREWAKYDLSFSDNVHNEIVSHSSRESYQKALREAVEARKKYLKVRDSHTAPYETSTIREQFIECDNFLTLLTTVKPTK